MFCNLVSSLIDHEKIKTTDAKAKELRRHAERAICWAASVADLVAKDREKQTPSEKAELLHAVRMAKKTVKRQDSLHKLFHELGPRFLRRPGGYTRVLKAGYRAGDAAPVSVIELVE
jgi:large subunit ribosomal protein L17